MPRLSRLEVIESGSRRRWTAAEKRRIVAESFAGPRNASATARRYGLSTSQVFGWRKALRSGRLGTSEVAGFAAAVVVPDPPAPAPAASTIGTGRMEISIRIARVVVDASVDAAALARVLDVLSGRC